MVKVNGAFRRGDIVTCVSQDGREVARGLVNYTSEEAAQIVGKSSAEIESILGYGFCRGNHPPRQYRPNRLTPIKTTPTRHLILPSMSENISKNCQIPTPLSDNSDMALYPIYCPLNSALTRVFVQKPNQAPSARKRLFKRFFKRAARFLWCKFFVTARSMFDVASRYAEVAASSSLDCKSLRNFLIAVRNAERWLMLRVRCLLLWRARFRACDVFAKVMPRFVQQGFKKVRLCTTFHQKSSTSRIKSCCVLPPTSGFYQLFSII